MNQLDEIDETQLSVFGSRGGQFCPLMHVALLKSKTLISCVLIHIRIKGEVGTVKMFKPSSIFFTDRSKAVSLDPFCYLCFICA